MELITTREDRERAFEILQKAFHSSPGMDWMLRKRNSAYSKKWIIKVLFTEAESKGGAFLTSDKNGVVFFYHLSKRTHSLKYFFQKAFVSLFITGIKNAIRCYRYQKKVASIRPNEGWLGMLLATDSSTNGMKAALEIKQAVFGFADETNEYIYAETTSPRASLLYQKAGYELYRTIRHPYDDLTIWFYRRQPSIYSLKKVA